jgi:hypothetical protein
MDKDKTIKDAQYRKGLSIAFFNATNAAISLMGDKWNLMDDEIRVKELISKYRDWFLEQHKDYYAKVISNVGQLYDKEDSFLRLKGCKNIEELKSIWLSLSQDERRDPDILKTKEELKESYETIR